MVDARTWLAGAAAPDVQATFCATLVDEWLRLGVRHAVVAPGSRSTPMAIALTDRTEMSIHVVHDERVAAFTALGLGLPTGTGRSAGPALLLCTSGTAAANFFPAVVEAGLSEIPMIVCTADRPDELRGVGAPQTIDQVDLYGRHVRWSADPGVREADTADGWRSIAGTAWSRSATGPVQLNLAFREPLLGTPGPLPPALEVGVVEAAEEAGTDPVPADFDSERGVILVGGSSGVEPERIVELHTRTGWPIVADPLSRMRNRATVSTVDALLRVEAFAVANVPETIVRIGRPSASKVLAQWTAGVAATLVQVGGPGRIDPAHDVAAVCSIDDVIAAADGSADDGSWLESWRRADERADRAIADAIDRHEELTEPAVARTIAEHLPTSAHLTVSSSMPVRDLEWFGGRRAIAHSNRGANGIDGVVSTALGRTLGRPGSPGFVFLGDLAFVHDQNAMVGLANRDVDLRIVVVDNDGGGIFSFLPQAEALDHDRYEQLFGTPLGVDVLGLAAAHGIATSTVGTRSDLVTQMTRPGPWVCRVASDRITNVTVHAEINAAVADSLLRLPAANPL